MHIDSLQSNEEVKQREPQATYVIINMDSNKEYHDCTNLLQE